MRSILNKLTKEKFDTLSAQLIDIVIEAVEDAGGLLKEIVTIVFDKALSEKYFAALYSELCCTMDQKLPAVQTKVEKDGEEVLQSTTFKRILLNKCQDEFMRGVTEISKENITEEEYEYKLAAQKRRMLGNIRFIGELFKLDMIVERIMHECVQHLLQSANPDEQEENLVSVCDLLTTIGKKLDHKKAKSHMDVYFTRMDSLSKQKQLPSRIRFMCELHLQHTPHAHTKIAGLLGAMQKIAAYGHKKRKQSGVWT